MGWFSLRKRSEPAKKTPSPLPAPDPTVDVFERLDRTMRAWAPELQGAGDRLYLSLLLRALKNDGVEVPAMPRDMVEIQRLLSSPNTGADELAHAVQRDPTVAGKFLAVANSPVYASVRRIATVRDAVVRIGLNQAGLIVMAITSSARLFRVPGFEAEAARLNAHSLGTAAVAKLLAPMAGFESSDAFLAGLLHDIGRVFMLSVVPRVHRESRGRSAVQPESLELLLKSLHAGFSGVIARAWEYPEDFVDAVARHHDPELASEEALAEMDSLTVLVCAANRLDKSASLGDAPGLPAVLRSLGIELDEALFVSCRQHRADFLDQLGVASAPQARAG